MGIVRVVEDVGFRKPCRELLQLEDRFETDEPGNLGRLVWVWVVVGGS